MFFCSFSRVIDCLRWRRRAKQNLCDLSEQSAASTSFGHVNVIKKKKEKEKTWIRSKHVAGWTSPLGFGPKKTNRRCDRQQRQERRGTSHPVWFLHSGRAQKAGGHFEKGSRGVEWIVRWCWCLLLFLLPTLSGWWSLLFVLKTPLALSSIKREAASEEISFPLFSVCRGKALPCHDWIIAIIAEGRGLLCAWVLPVLLAQRGNSRGQNLPWNRHTKEGAVKATRPGAGSNCSFLLRKPDVRFIKERVTGSEKRLACFFFFFLCETRAHGGQIREMEGASPPSSLLPLDVGV